MADVETAQTQQPDLPPEAAETLAKENFADLLEKSFEEEDRLQGKVVNGTVLSVENDFVLVDTSEENAERLRDSGDFPYIVGDATLAPHSTPSTHPSPFTKSDSVPSNEMVPSKGSMASRMKVPVAQSYPLANIRAPAGS